MYVCKEMVIIIPPPKEVAINCNTKTTNEKYIPYMLIKQI